MDRIVKATSSFYLHPCLVNSTGSLNQSCPSFLSSVFRSVGARFSGDWSSRIRPTILSLSNCGSDRLLTNPFRVLVHLACSLGEMSATMGYVRSHMTCCSRPDIVIYRVSDSDLGYQKACNRRTLASGDPKSDWQRANEEEHYEKHLWAVGTLDGSFSPTVLFGAGSFDPGQSRHWRHPISFAR
jgi:hypothetical protein